jgi:thiol-disulfide isomerase/thioredoxin
MKKSSPKQITVLTLIGSIIILADFLSCNSSTDPLKKLLAHLNQIKTASYNSELKASKAGGFIALNTNSMFVQMYSNPNDQFIGASFLYSNSNDINKLDGCYDGKYIVQLDWLNKNAIIEKISDENKSRLRAPFFIKVKLLIEYAIKNKDSSIVTIKSFKDSTKINFLFPDKLVEYFGTYPSVTSALGKNTSYELLINNKNKLPYKLIGKNLNFVFSEECRNIKISYSKGEKFIALSQIPSDYSRIQPNIAEEIILPSKDNGAFPAPDWRLLEVDGDSISLKDMKSKVLLLEFTGINCIPCRDAIPFLKQLANYYKDKSFELVSIETSIGDARELHRHKKKYEINYKYLIGNMDLIKKYKTPGVPSFIIIDENRIVRKIILGYTRGRTDRQILNVIDSLH